MWRNGLYVSAYGYLFLNAPFTDVQVPRVAHMCMHHNCKEHWKEQPLESITWPSPSKTLLWSRNADSGMPIYASGCICNWLHVSFRPPFLASIKDFRHHRCISSKDCFNLERLGFSGWMSFPCLKNKEQWCVLFVRLRASWIALNLFTQIILPKRSSSSVFCLRTCYKQPGLLSMTTAIRRKIIK